MLDNIKVCAGLSESGFVWVVSQFRSFIKYWLPVLAWMALIFSGSGDARSSAHSSRIIVPLMRWLFPHIAQEDLDLVVLLVRKCAHLAEYAVLASQGIGGRYVKAIELAGLKVRYGDPEAIVKGLAIIARHAGLIP